MAIEYRIYSGDHDGGPVDYSAPVATVSGTTYATAPLPAPSATNFAVRAYDTDSGLEEDNVDARCRIVIDADGNDVTDLPAAPAHLTITPRAAGGLVSWSYPPTRGASAPTGFRVYAGGPTPDYGTPIGTLAYSPGRSLYLWTVNGLAAGTYQLAVRAYNATGEEANTTTVPIAVAASTLLAVDDLTATIDL